MTTRRGLSDLLPATNYAIRIRAIGEAGKSEWSQRLTFTTVSDTVAPSAPANTTWAVSGNSFHGEWDAVATNVDGNTIAVTRYEVELTANFVTKIVSVSPVVGSKPSYDLSYEQNRALFATSTTYAKPVVDMRVRAVDNKELKSAWTTVITASNPVPAAPTTLTTSLGANSITVGWTAPSDTDIIAYNVYQGTSASPTTKVASVNGTFYTATVGSAAQYFSIKALDAFGQESTALSGGPFTAPTPYTLDGVSPSAPTALAATITNNANGIGGRSSLTWTAPTTNTDASTLTDLNGYELQYKRNADTAWDSKIYGKDVVSALIDLAYAYTAYDFRIRAFDFNANYSAFQTINKAAVADVAPANVTGLAGSAGKDSIVWTWTPVADLDIKNYEVTFSTSSTFASGNLTFLTGTSTTLNVGGLLPGTQYYARVRAVDNSGLTSAAFSSTVNVATVAYSTYTSDGAAPASSPTPTVTSEIASLAVAWTPITNNDPVTYEVHLSTTSGFTPTPGGATRCGEVSGSFYAIDNLPGTSTPLTYGTTYYVKLIAKDKDNAAAASAQASGVPQKILAADFGATIGGSNKVLNSSFEDWSGTLPAFTGKGVNATITKVTGYIGSNAVNFTATTAGNVGNNRFNISTDPYIVGGKYTISYYARRVSGTGELATGRDSVGYPLSQTTFGASANPTSWQRFVTTFTLPGSGTFDGQFFCPTVANDVFEIDGVQIELGDVVTSWGISPQDGLTAANTAQTTANGKNKVTYSTSTPGSTANVAGDIWFQTSGATVIGQYQGNGGTSWTQVTITNTVIANLDAAKITTGFLDVANRIQTNSLVADKIATGTLTSAIITLSTGGFIQSTGYVAGTSGFRLSSTTLDITTGSINAGTITSGGIGSSVALTLNGNMVVQTGGYLKSSNYSGSTTTSGSAGWFLGEAGLTIVNGAVSASAITTGTLGSTTGVINIASGASLVLNGGYMRSNTYNGSYVVTGGTTPGTYYAYAPLSNGTSVNGGTVGSSTAPTAGFYLGNDGLMIASGSVKAEAISGGTFTAGTITVGSGGAITGFGGAFSLSSTGLTITNGTISARALSITVGGGNRLPNSSFETSTISPWVAEANTTAVISTADAYQGTKSMLVTHATAGGGVSVRQNTVPMVSGTSYILSAWVKRAAGTQGVAMTVSNSTTISSTNTYAAAPVGWTRISLYFTATSTFSDIFIYNASSLGVASTGTGSAFYLDGVQLEQGDVLTGYSPKADEILPGTVQGDMVVANSINANVLQANTAINQNLNVTSTLTIGSVSTAGTVTSYTGSGMGGSSGWSILSDGTAYFNSVYIKGNLQGNSSSVISGGTITGGTIQTNTGSNSIIRITSAGLIANNASGTTVFSVDGTTGNTTIGGTTVVSGTTTLGGALSVTGGISVTGTAGTAYIRGGGFSGTTSSGASGTGYILDAGGLYIGGGSTISSATITGGTIRTASSGNRIEMTYSADPTFGGAIKFYYTGSGLNTGFLQFGIGGFGAFTIGSTDNAGRAPIIRIFSDGANYMQYGQGSTGSGKTTHQIYGDTYINATDDSGLPGGVLDMGDNGIVKTNRITAPTLASGTGLATLNINSTDGMYLNDTTGVYFSGPVRANTILANGNSYVTIGATDVPLNAAGSLKMGSETVTIPSGANPQNNTLAVTFPVQFHATRAQVPTVMVNVQGGAQNLSATATSISRTGFTITVNRFGASATSVTVNWLAFAPPA